VDIPECILCPFLWIPGIKAGMLIRDAKARCPHLTVVPYNFDAYGEVYFLLTYHDCQFVLNFHLDTAFVQIEILVWNFIVGC
jgi:hypothetical protein